MAACCFSSALDSQVLRKVVDQVAESLRSVLPDSAVVDDVDARLVADMVTVQVLREFRPDLFEDSDRRSIWVRSSEFGAVLAGLRCLQAVLDRQDVYNDRDRLEAIHLIMTNEGRVAPLTTIQIDRLCERINSGDIS